MTIARSGGSLARATARQPFSAADHLAGQEFALGPVQLEREDELVVALPGSSPGARAGGEILERRGVGGRCLGALARDQIELCDLLALSR